MEHADIATVVILSGLGMLLLIGLTVVLFIVVHGRRLRHRAQVVEMQLKHAGEIHEVQQEVERQTLKEIGQELHDDVGHSLLALRMDLNNLLSTRNADPVMVGMKNTLDQAITELRRLSHTLIDGRQRERPILQALAEECARLNRPGTLSVSFIADGDEPHLDPDQKVVLYRIFQEAMSNALKHARADRIDVSLMNGGQVRLRIQDNGVGFSVGTDTDGHGLSNIKRRAELIGFRVHLVSAPGEGTSIILAQ